MQRKFTLFPAIALLALIQLAAIQNLYAQGVEGTDDDGFIVQILSPASIAQEVVHGYNGMECNWVGSTYGPSLTSDLCGEVVWADDSLGCTAPLADLTGKIAFIRRGTCSFSLKVYNAQLAGAIGVIIANHYTNATDGPCTAFVPSGLIFGGMSGLDSSALVTIPSVFLHRQTSEAIDAALVAGETVNVCFSLPRFFDATGPYNYATPVTQVDTITTLGVNYVNREATLQEDVVLKAEITEPNGNVVTLTTTIDVEAGKDSFYLFPAYLPPSIVGDFNVLFTNSAYTDSRDSLHYKFVQTEYTFATDKLVNDPGGIGTTNTNFISGDFIHQEGALFVTGPAGGVATYVTFGISNIDSVFVADAPVGSTANDVTIFIYDGDADDDGTIDLGTSFDDLTQVGFGVYTMTGNEQDGVLLDVEIGDFLTGGPVTLEARHPYYVSLYYNGLEAGYGRDIRFSNSLEEWDYTDYPTTAVSVGNGTALTFFGGGWVDADVIQRVQLEGYVPGSSSVKPDLLADAQVLVNPNPATDVLRVNLKLEAVSEVVTLTLFDRQGRVVSVQKAQNVQEGQMTLQVQTLPAGTYFLWVRTADGQAMRKVSVIH